MPKYGYLCLNCEKRFRKFLTYEEYGTIEVQCPYCESKKLKRLLNRVRIGRTEEQRLEKLADPSGLEGLEDDPKALGKMMRQLSREAGEDLGPEFDEVIDRLEKGQSPEDIEAALPELGEMGDTGGMGGMGDLGGLDTRNLEDF